MAADGNSRLSQLPSMTRLLETARRRAGLCRAPRDLLTDVLRTVLEARRRMMRDGPASAATGGDPVDMDELLDQAAEVLRQRSVGRIRRVINATGVVLHTGLGRSVLAPAAIDRLGEVARGYCNLEIDLATGGRGQRGQYAERLLCDLTGAESALIVNNNAAATMLALRHLAGGREVIVSRGQLIEIGGSYRLPEIMTASGATLREVGTTNKTRLADYEAAINERTALLLRVHTSNYRVIGFSESPDIKALVELGARRGLPVMDDLGSGALLNDPLWRSADEPTVVDSLKAGADVVCFSGDKLLGGPQAGILLGRQKTIDALRRDPMARALRVDKLTLAALEATLELHQSPETLHETLPTLKRLKAAPDVLRRRAEDLLRRLRITMPEESFELTEDQGFAGGGSMPEVSLPGVVIRRRPAGLTAEEAAGRLRMGDPPVLARIANDALLLDVRTVEDDEMDPLTAALHAALTMTTQSAATRSAGHK